MSNETVKWTMVTRLEYLAAGGEPDRLSCGICEDLTVAEDYERAVLDAVLRTHPKYSGSHVYPIPDPSRELTPMGAYHEKSNLWVGEYGDLRRDFAAHAARYLREQGYE